MSGATSTQARRRVLAGIALALLLVGAALMAMMVLTEGEPGLLPLLMVVAGGVGSIALRLRRPPR